MRALLPDELLAVITITSLLSAAIGIALGYRLALNEVRFAQQRELDLLLKQKNLPTLGAD